MLHIRIDKEFAGPSLLEMEPLLGEGDAPLEVAWKNTQGEIGLVRSLRHRDVTLVVDDPGAMKRAAVSVGGRFEFETRQKLNAVQALNGRRVVNWPEFSKQVGSDAAQGLLMAIAADLITKKRNPVSLRKVVDMCLFQDVSPDVADALVAL